jgi:hypothetical protein
VRVSSWVLHADVEGQWSASRQLPCPGRPRRVLCIDGEDPRSWSSDRWAGVQCACGGGYFVACACTDMWGDLLRPLGGAERNDAIRKSRATRPSKSGWKLAFLAAFPQWAQDAYWQLLDTQRACAIVAQQVKIGIQIHLPKAVGVRPIALLEESFKAIEGPVARRKAAVRARMAVGAVYIVLRIWPASAASRPRRKCYTSMR